MTKTWPSRTANDCLYRSPDPANLKRPVCAQPAAVRALYRGALDAPLALVVPAPGEADGGPAEQLLDRFLAEAGLGAEPRVFVPAVQCSAEQHGAPKKRQIDMCREHVWQVLGAHPRRLILCLGNEAWSCLWECKPSGVLSGAGTFRAHEFGMTLWTLHPAAVLRQPELAPVLAKDLRAAYLYLTEGTKPELPDLDWLLVHPDHADPTADDNLLGALRTLTPGPQDKLVVDTETSGTDAYRDTLLGVGCYFAAHEKAVYVALNHGEHAAAVWSEEQRWILQDLLRRWLTAPGPRLLQNVHFDVTFLYQQLGIDLLPVAYDTLVEANLTDENSLKGLKERAMRHLGAPAWDRIWSDGKGRTLSDYAETAGLHLGMVPVQEVARYCCYDCYYTYRLHEFYQTQMTAAQRELETRFLRPQMNQLLRIGRRGVQVDVEGIRRLGEALDEAVVEAAAEVNRLAGTAQNRYSNDKRAPLGLNLASVPQKRLLFFGLLGLGCFVPQDNREFLTDKGELSTSAFVIEHLLAHGAVSEQAKEILRGVQRHGKLVDMRSDFVKAMLARVQRDGKVHAEFTQFRTATGRLSCKGPNLQQVGKELRPFFIAPEGYSYLESDYSEIEVRCWAQLSGDPRLLQALSEEPDFHRYTVGMALHKPPAEVTDEERQRGKVLTFGGTMYRGGAPVIARSMGLSLGEAQELYEKVQRLYSRGAAWMEYQIEFCRKHGYVCSPLGRIRRLPGINSPDKKTRTECERQSVNSGIQGLASDLTGLAALRVEQRWEREGVDGWIAVLVHDSIVTIVRDEHLEQAERLLVEEMCRPPYQGWTVPLRAKTTISKRWNGELDLEAILRNVGVTEEQDAG